MKPDLHIVLNCTNRKRVPDSGFPRLRDVTGDIQGRVGRWTARIDATAPTLDAADLYAGEYWRAGRDLMDAASLHFNTNLWVLSAGLGLINGRDRVCAYGATLGSSHPDSVIPPGLSGRSRDMRRAWWTAISTWPGPAHAGAPRTLGELAVAGREAVILVCAGPDYIDAVAVDLATASVALVEPSHLLVFASGPPKPGLESSWVQVPGRLRMQLGGSMTSTGPRTARAVIGAYSTAGRLTPGTARAIVNLLVGSAAPLPQYDRKRLDDQGITEWIISALQADRHATKSPALREFRDQGMACEQSRFGRLFDCAQRGVRE